MNRELAYIKQGKDLSKDELQSTITCPHCKHQTLETMPDNYCQFFYSCPNCKEILKPLAGDCCVYCSYGTASCPPVQNGMRC